MLCEFLHIQFHSCLQISPQIGNGADYVFTQNRGTYALVYVSVFKFSNDCFFIVKTQNSMVLGETELAPFRLGDGKYWTTDHARRLDKFAYNKCTAHLLFLQILFELDNYRLHLS